MATEKRRWRRHYAPGRCGDCGRTRRVTMIWFWVNAYKMRVCADCIKPYRSVLLTHTPREG